MASTDSTPTPETATPHDRKVIFDAFKWHHRAQRGAPVVVDGGQVAEFAGGVRDVASGVRDIMQIIERDALDADCADSDNQPAPAMLGLQQTANLTRLCIWALDRLDHDCEKMVSYLDNAQPVRTI